MKWSNRYRELGVQGLFDLPRSGRKTKLAPLQESTLAKRIDDGPTAEDSVSNFDGPTIRGILYKEFGISFSESGVYSLLRRLGFSWKSSRPQHEKNDPAAVAHWKRETLPNKYKEVRQKYPDKKVELWFQDEMRFGEKTPQSRRWSRKSVDTRQIKQLGFRNTHIYGAVNPCSGERVGLVYPGCNSDVMSIHLDLVSQQLGGDRHAILVLDCAGWHESSKQIIVPPNITLLSLPSYSPELNPVERLWRWVKSKHLANRLIRKNEDLEKLGCELWQKLTDDRVKSICKVSYEPFSNFL